MESAKKSHCSSKLLWAKSAGAFSLATFKPTIHDERCSSYETFLVTSIQFPSVSYFLGK